MCKCLGYKFLEPYSDWNYYHLMKDGSIIPYSRKGLIEIMKQALRKDSIASLPTDFKDFL